MKRSGKTKEVGRLLSDEELDAVSGGVDAVSGGAGGNKSYIFDLSRFTSRIVCNVVTLRREPSGAIIPGIGWKNGERIMVHREYTENGWYFAYDNRTDKYGYVNPNCVL